MSFFPSHHPLSDSLPIPQILSPPLLMEEGSSEDNNCSGKKSWLYMPEEDIQETHCGLKYWLNEAKHSRCSTVQSNVTQQLHNNCLGPQSHPTSSTKTVKIQNKVMKRPTQSTADLKPARSKKRRVLTKDASTQLNAVSLGDIQLALDELVQRIRFRWQSFLRQVSLSELEANMRTLQQELKQPVKKETICSRPAVFIRAVCLAMKSALAYDMQQVQQQSSVFMLAKYENQLKEFGMMLFSLMKEYQQTQSTSTHDSRLDAMNQMVYLAIAASRACLCTQLYRVWSMSTPAAVLGDDPEQFKSSCLSWKRGHGPPPPPSLHKNTDVLSSVSSSGGGDMSTGSLVMLNSMNLDNPASNASHETHQESPASTLSHLSGGGSTTNTTASSIGSSSATFILPSATFLSLRAREFAVKSEENWMFYEHERKTLLDGSSTKARAAQRLDKLLQNHFPWGLDLQSLRFANDAFLVLSMLEGISEVFRSVETNPTAFWSNKS